MPARPLGLPTLADMQRVIERQHADITRLYPDSPRYALELDLRVYRASLAGEMRRAAKAKAG